MDEIKVTYLERKLPVTLNRYTSMLRSGKEKFFLGNTSRQQIGKRGRLLRPQGTKKKALLQNEHDWTRIKHYLGRKHRFLLKKD